MASSFAASRLQIVYALCLPLAVLLGYFLAEPLNLKAIGLVGIVLGVLAMPVVMRWYHPMLILTWNAAITPNFLPGQPFLWMLIAFAGFGVAVLNRLTNPDAKFIEAPSISRSLVFLLLVVLITAWLRGGIGVRSLGSSSYGGKGYFYILAAVAGYFALISQRVPAERASLFVGLFFLSGLTALVPNLAFLGGPIGEQLYWLFPPAYAWEQVASQYGSGGFGRLYGLTLVAPAIYCWLYAKYGLRGTLDPRKPWRGGMLILSFVACLFGGFRWHLALFITAFALQFYFEGLLRSRFAILGAGLVVLSLSAALPFTEKLPIVVQRTLSLLPVEVSPLARESARGSSEWRIDMWRQVLPEVPQYLLQGKGYAVDPDELAFAIENMKRGFGAQAQGSIVAGDYHNGPLSIVIPFGIWGIIGFFWFLYASFKYLHRKYRDGPQSLKMINTFILAFFTARLVMFLLVFGAFYIDLFVFTGLVGLSVSVNGPLGAKRQEVAEPEQTEEDFEELRPRKELVTG